MVRKFSVFIIIVVIVLAVLQATIYPYVSVEEKTVVIKKLDHKIYNEQDTWLVFTENDGVYENTDCWIRKKYDSSDMQNKLEEGKKFTISYYGWRIPAINLYPNVFKAVKIEESVTDSIPNS
jgi:hypothetical protein